MPDNTDINSSLCAQIRTAEGSHRVGELRQPRHGTMNIVVHARLQFLCWPDGLIISNRSKAVCAIKLVP
jgi:hypothetical protein